MRVNLRPYRLPVAHAKNIRHHRAVRGPRPVAAVLVHHARRDIEAALDIQHRTVRRDVPAIRAPLPLENKVRRTRCQILRDRIDAPREIVPFLILKFVPRQKSCKVLVIPLARRTPHEPVDPARRARAREAAVLVLFAERHLLRGVNRHDHRRRQTDDARPVKLVVKRRAEIGRMISQRRDFQRRVTLARSEEVRLARHLRVVVREQILVEFQVVPQRRRQETITPAWLIQAFPRPQLRPVAHQLLKVRVLPMHAVLIVGHAAESVVAERLNLARQLLRAAPRAQHVLIRRAERVVFAVLQIREMRLRLGINQIKRQRGRRVLTDLRLKAITPRRERQTQRVGNPHHERVALDDRRRQLVPQQREPPPRRIDQIHIHRRAHRRALRLREHAHRDPERLAAPKRIASTQREQPHAHGLFCRDRNPHCRPQRQHLGIVGRHAEFQLIRAIHERRGQRNFQFAGHAVSNRFRRERAPRALALAPHAREGLPIRGGVHLRDLRHFRGSIRQRGFRQREFLRGRGELHTQFLQCFQGFRHLLRGGVDFFLQLRGRHVGVFRFRRVERLVFRCDRVRRGSPRVRALCEFAAQVAQRGLRRIERVRRRARRAVGLDNRPRINHAHRRAHALARLPVTPRQLRDEAALRALHAVARRDAKRLDRKLRQIAIDKNRRPDLGHLEFIRLPSRIPRRQFTPARLVTAPPVLLHARHNRLRPHLALDRKTINRHLDHAVLHVQSRHRRAAARARLNARRAEMKRLPERMQQITLRVRARRQPDRERREFLEHRQQLARLVRALARRRRRIRRVAQREIRQRRRAHRHRQIALIGIRPIRAHRHRIRLDAHHAVGDEQLRVLRGKRAIRGDVEDVIPRPQHMIARLQHRLRNRQAINVFALVVALEKGLVIEQHIARPAHDLHAHLPHLDARRRRDRIDDRLAPLELVHRRVRLIERHEPQLDFKTPLRHLRRPRVGKTREENQHRHKPHRDRTASARGSRAVFGGPPKTSFH